MSSCNFKTQTRKGWADPSHSRDHKRRVALLGAGYIAEWHARALTSVKQVELVAICDRVRSRAQALAERFSVGNVYNSLDDMLSAERLDAVHVLVPPDFHFQAALAILAAGVNTLIEKPMCVTATNCDALVRLAQARNLRLGVGHNFLFANCYERLRMDVKKGCSRSYRSSHRYLESRVKSAYARTV